MTTLFGDDMSVPGDKDDRNEWYTMAPYIEAARAVMGSIDLDPASCEEANKIVHATAYYTQEDDGLLQPWHGNIWCNPPYGFHPSGKSNVVLWSQRLISAFNSGEIEQAVLLTMVNTESSWFVPLWKYLVCFPSPRVMFHRPDGSLDHHLQGSCFVYLGGHEERFIKVFSKFGHVVKAVGAPAQPAAEQSSLWQEEVTA